MALADRIEDDEEDWQSIDRLESAPVVHATMTGDRIALNRGGSSRVRVSARFPGVQNRPARGRYVRAAAYRACRLDLVSLGALELPPIDGQICAEARPHAGKSCQTTSTDRSIASQHG